MIVSSYSWGFKNLHCQFHIFSWNIYSCDYSHSLDLLSWPQVFHIPAGLGTGIDCHPLPAKLGTQDTSLLPYLESRGVEVQPLPFCQ